MAASPNVVEKGELSEAKRRLLEQRLRGGGKAAEERIEPRAVGARTPVSVDQHRIWLHAAMEPELPIYNESVTVARRGSFDAEAFERSFNEVLRRHESWRTCFRMECGELMQVVVLEVWVNLPVVDLSELPEEEREPEARRLATAEAGVPICMETAPLLRALVVRMGAGEHRLLLTLHHIVFDGVSLHRVLVPELAAIYEAFAAREAFAPGERSAVAEPELHYADYTLWRAERVKSAAVERQLAYWRRELAGELPVLRLPADRARPAVMSHRGETMRFAFPPELMRKLRAFSRARGATLYMTLLAGLKAVFFRYSGQEDVIVGGLADGRRRPELDGVMGYFLDTFAIRTRPTAELPFAEYLREVRLAVLGALANAEVPFSRVVEAVQPARDRGQHPVFQTFMALQPQGEPFAEGWELKKTEVDGGCAKFDLYIEVDDKAEYTTARVMYRTDLFEVATIERLAGHWIRLLEGVVEWPAMPLGELPLLTAGERETMLDAWNRTAYPVPAETLHGLVSAQAEETPDADAVECEGVCWSYAELEREAGRLAGALRAAGAARGTLVAVCLERTAYLPAALLAILKTGAAYLPLDPATPQARRELCLEDAAPAVVLTERGLLGDLPETNARVLVLEEALAGAAEWVGDVAGGVVGGLDEAAYVIHTSGSTGRPKGVEISHRAVVNLLTSMQWEPGFCADDVLLAVTTISFDIAGLEMFLPLISGGRVVVAPRAVALDPVLLASEIERTGATVLQATPSTWRALLGSGWLGKKGLRCLCGGEAMTRDLADGLPTLGLEVWNVYGPTETTIWSTVHRVSRVAAGSGQVSVGRPIANTTAYVLDARRQPVPVNVAGELYLGGMGLANGYRGQPELTAARFVMWNGERLYRTGDYVLYRADGTIEVQGRADNQVKVRGYRIELEDVEAALLRHPVVETAAAKAWPDAAGGNRLSAYLVGRAGVRPPDAGQLREFLKALVPEYMIPSDVVALEAMPLTANGKMDRKALPTPAVVEERVVAVEPESATERRLAALWRELLRVGAVGMDENFFDLGGHSLLVARLQQRIAEEFGRRLPMAAIFHAPTLRRQTALLERGAEGMDTARIIPLQPKGTRPVLFWMEPTRLIVNLGAALGEEQPLLGVTMTEGDLLALGEAPELTAIAACYAATVLKAQPGGPYLLGGLCLGGLLAYEVASQLRGEGHEVAAVAMVDAENPLFYRRFDTLPVEWNKLWFYLRRAVFGGGGAMFVRHARSRVRRLLRMDDAASTEMSAVGNAILAAALRYQPPVYGGDVQLLVPRDRPGLVDYLSGWEGMVVGRLRCEEVEGHHDELLMPAFAGGLAAAIGRNLAKVRGL